MVQDQITQEVVINAPHERVWTLLTEGIGQWFPKDGADVDLRVGGEIILHWKQYGSFRGVVERLDPMTHFSVRWSLNQDELPTPGLSTLVEFTVIPEASGVRVVVVESGFSQLHLPQEEQDARRNDNIGGWIIELGELRSLAEQTAT